MNTTVNIIEYYKDDLHLYLYICNLKATMLHLQLRPDIYMFYTELKY